MTELTKLVDGVSVALSELEVAAFEAARNAAQQGPPVEEYQRAVQMHVDAVAQQRNYDSGITCASYIGSTNEVWAAEAATFIGWRDAVWTYAYGELAKVQAGQRAKPTIHSIIGELPIIEWGG